MGADVTVRHLMYSGALALVAVGGYLVNAHPVDPLSALSPAAPVVTDVPVGIGSAEAASPPRAQARPAAAVRRIPAEVRGADDASAGNVNTASLVAPATFADNFANFVDPSVLFAAARSGLGLGAVERGADTVVSPPVVHHDLERSVDQLTAVLAVSTGEFTAAERARPADRVSRTVEVDRGDTLIGVLTRADVPTGTAHVAVQALSEVYDPRRLRPGQDVTVIFETSARRPFVGMTLTPDAVRTVGVERKTAGGFAAHESEKTVTRAELDRAGSIETSLYEAAVDAGVAVPVLIDLIRAYSYDVDFQRDIQPGDSFAVVYEEGRTADGDLAGYGDILAARLVLSGVEMPIVRFEGADGSVDYYDPDGMSVRKALLRTPVDGARISSGFGMRRHPILGYSKMHKGVDFAAPTGTPIYAAGDGVVERASRFSSYGHYVRIRHTSEIKTVYAHLSRYGAGIRSGTRVQQGDVIGYVGSTGRSTGPHLHYEVLVNGDAVNPQSIDLPSGRQLEGDELQAFRRQAEEMIARLDRLSAGPTVVAANEAAE